MAAKVILLVEDNPDDIALTLRALKKSNIANEVLVAHDGEEALDLLLTQGVRPALTLLDLKMPKISGLEVLQRLRANPETKLLPVVILTSSKQESDLARGYELGANSYVRKPVNFNDFAEAVRELGLYWLVLNEPPAASTGARER